MATGQDLTPFCPICGASHDDIVQAIMIGYGRDVIGSMTQQQQYELLLDDHDCYDIGELPPNISPTILEDFGALAADYTGMMTTRQPGEAAFLQWAHGVWSRQGGMAGQGTAAAYGSTTQGMAAVGNAVPQQKHLASSRHSHPVAASSASIFAATPLAGTQFPAQQHLAGTAPFPPAAAPYGTTMPATSRVGTQFPAQQHHTSKQRQQ
jgi:hypothetical protein